jgi:hypothetical protein
MTQVPTYLELLADNCLLRSAFVGWCINNEHKFPYIATTTEITGIAVSLVRTQRIDYRRYESSVNY